MNVARRPLRVLAVAGKETVEILRRPSALVSVVAGPVLILGLFGLGYLGQPPLRAELVIPPGSGLSDQPAAYTDLASDRVDIVGVTWIFVDDPYRPSGSRPTSRRPGSSCVPARRTSS